MFRGGGKASSNAAPSILAKILGWGPVILLISFLVGIVISFSLEYITVRRSLNAYRLQTYIFLYHKPNSFQIAEEFRLKSDLYEAQIAKAKVEKAELNADFNKERLELQKQQLEAKKNIEILLTREENLKEQIELYASQYDSMVKGVNDKKTNVGTFKTQVDNLNQKLKTLQSDTTMWKEKFDESNEVVVKMNTAAANSGIELEATKRKLAAMEKLNRTLQAERTKLLVEVKSKDKQQNGNH